MLRLGNRLRHPGRVPRLASACGRSSPVVQSASVPRMERRRLGRTEHRSSVAVLGCCAFGDGDQDAAHDALHLALDAGVNHLDIAPSYGEAERALGPSLPEVRDRVFLGCKTTERSGDAARAEMEHSLELLGVDAFDLYQFHAVTSMDELAALLAPGGAAEAVLAAREEGLTRCVGITGHFLDVPRVFLAALDRLELDTVMFPVGIAHWRDAAYRASAEALLEACAQRDVGVLAIKALARRPWGEARDQGDRGYGTWYEPLDEEEQALAAISFTLSLPVTAFTTPCDRRLLPLALRAAERFAPIDLAAAETVLAGAELAPLVGPIG